MIDSMLHIWLDETSQELCVVVAPYVNYKTNISLWDSNLFLNFPSKAWKKYYTTSTTPVSISSKLVPSPSLGNTTFYFLIKFYISWKQMVSLLTHSNVNGPFRTLIGLATGLLPQVWTLCLKKFKVYYKCTNQKIFCTCMVFLVLSIITYACGHDKCTFLCLFPAIWERKHFIGLLKLTLHSNVRKHI